MAFQTKCWVSFLTTALKPCRSLLSLFSSTFWGLWTCQILNGVLLLRVPKASNYQSRFLFEDKCFFLKKNYKLVIFLFFFALWAKDFHTSDVNVSAVFSNLRCACPERVFGRKNSWKKTAFNFCFDFRQNLSRLSAVFFGFAFHNFHFSFLEQNVAAKNCLKNKEFSIFFTILNGRFSHFRERCWVSFLTAALKPCRSLFSMFSYTFCGFWTCQVLNEVLW